MTRLLRRPDELAARLRNRLEVWVDRLARPGRLDDVRDPAEQESEMALLLPELAGARLPTCPVIEEHVERAARGMSPARGTFPRVFNGSRVLGRLCYLAARALQPRVIIETGVAHGVTSAYLLQALHENGAGILISVDLSPLGVAAEDSVGCFVPSHLRDRWDLRRGSARKLLPGIVKEAGPIDLFVHDSLHTYFHMKWEFDVALSSLRPGGLLIADDVEGNRAFEAAARHARAVRSIVFRQDGKQALCGVIRMRAGE
jgi:predicted O-methyltransferase YrrM